MAGQGSSGYRCEERPYHLDGFPSDTEKDGSGYHIKEEDRVTSYSNQEMEKLYDCRVAGWTRDLNSGRPPLSFFGRRGIKMGGAVDPNPQKFTPSSLLIAGMPKDSLAELNRNVSAEASSLRLGG